MYIYIYYIYIVVKLQFYAPQLGYRSGVFSWCRPVVPQVGDIIVDIAGHPVGGAWISQGWYPQELGDVQWGNCPTPVSL